jgi:molybdopterin-guanine dinucleotide biosynthesis protein A
MPEMTETYLRSLIERVEPGYGVLPAIGERMEPLAAVYPTNALRCFSEALKGENFSLQGVARELLRAGRASAWRVRPEDEHLFRNLNEPVAGHPRGWRG